MKILLAAGSVVGLLSAAAPPPQTPQLLEKGKATFAIYCVACHGEKGDGSGPAAVALNPKPRNFTTDKFKNGNKPEELFKTISEGLPGTPMVGFNSLPEEDRWALAYHVRSFVKADPKDAPKTPVKDSKKKK